MKPSYFEVQRQNCMYGNVLSRNGVRYYREPFKNEYSEIVGKRPCRICKTQILAIRQKPIHSEKNPKLSRRQLASMRRDVAIRENLPVIPIWYNFNNEIDRQNIKTIRKATEQEILEHQEKKKREIRKEVQKQRYLIERKKQQNHKEFYT